MLRHYQGFHLGTRIPARWDSLPHYGRGGGRAVHHVGSQPCGRGEDSLHEQRPRRVQGRQGLRCSYDDEGGAVRVLQRLRAQLHAARFLEHRSLDHLRAVQSLREEAEPVNNRTSLYRPGRIFVDSLTQTHKTQLDTHNTQTLRQTYTRAATVF